MGPSRTITLAGSSVTSSASDREGKLHSLPQAEGKGTRSGDTLRVWREVPKSQGGRMLVKWMWKETPGPPGQCLNTGRARNEDSGTLRKWQDLVGERTKDRKVSSLTPETQKTERL